MHRNPLARLGDFGQSVWCDDISREFLLAGRLRSLIAEDGVSGLTSNPTIFHKAIAGTTGYDREIETLIAEGASTVETLEALMVEDIRAAADQLASVCEATSSRDGWVSIEVAPAWAYDTQGTVTEALRIRSMVDRPNVLVKVPATREGVAAIRDLTARGCPINVTLIFSLQRYAEVMEAYFAGLEALQARRDGGEQAPGLGEVRSVASFFVSRVDTAVDARLDALAAEAESSGPGGVAAATSFRALRGRAAVANAKGAYELFRSTFHGERWGALRARGAEVQRPLWASTSTKNPKYSDILYVQELIGPDTVNTMPLATMDHYRDHGRPTETLTVGVELAAAHFEELEECGIDMGEITAGLEREGVQAFADSFEALLMTLDQKRITLEKRGRSAP